MTERSAQEAVETIKARVREEGYELSDTGYGSMLDQMIYFEDVDRAIDSGELASWYLDEKRRLRYLIRGFSVQERNLVVGCRLLPKRVEVFVALWA